MVKRVAVVSGSNKGLGFAIVRGLCKQFDGDVYLTARDEGRGKAAVEELKKEGLHPKFHLLDINSLESIQTLRKFLQENYGGLDILVNNAAIAYKGNSTVPFTEQADVSVATNFTALATVCTELFPLLRPHARVVNVSGLLSVWALRQMSAEKKQAILGVRSQADIEAFMAQFVSDVKDGVHEKKGWPNSALATSKVGVTALTLVQQAELTKDKSRPGIIVNAACPGNVQTDMSGYAGGKTPDEGADTILYLALLPQGTQQPAGKLISDRKERPWE